ncbi:acylneuraminate cytidylyltransferase [Polaribacter reichenbachii]|uniref:N-acylneuraminate cytidylyltransferase n=1 Tax=Polaribacter reichenbachii TaxID=996801 RepID=A0A1B8TVL4_9FLAO|nr:acylneuraminate cytidylyltransferase [Polaribacter reichenbachii]APZ45333.1 acylneuraminate cytidylyltransferase [Polaribacter reichenbachii]AUC19195.1 acylneuraminate cytidylyltransferase [Polaribacter reichenbachii]OBY63648.1 acylneuraminate cytidylyltransferase [Polaribacter reichenbachii]
MKTVAFIPVREGSKSISLKNIKPFCGKPLIYWSLKAAVETAEIDEVVVATDSLVIKDTVKSFSFDKVSIYDRDKLNAQDSSPTESVMLEYLSKSNLSTTDNFILIQATSPLLSNKNLSEGFNLLKKNDSVLSCVRSKRFFWNEKGKPLNYDYKNRPRRQDFDGLLMENGAFYINSVHNILENKNRISGKIGVSIMPEYTAVEIDEEDDWIIAESLMKRFILKSQNKKSVKLVLTDVDGVLTDAGMYYSEKGDELKKFNTRDGKAFELLRKANIKTGIITSENTKIVERRAKKLKVDYLFQGKEHKGKLSAALDICKKINISLSDVAYIGDDLNCYELLSNVGFAACPCDAVEKVKSIPSIQILNCRGGEGVFREFVDSFLIN